MTYVRYWGSHFKHPRTCHLLRATMRSVRQAGWKSYLVCSRPPDDPRLAEEIFGAGTEIVYLPRPRRNFDPACVWRAYRLFRRLNCTVMHCDNMHTSPLIGAALAGVPVRLWSKRSMNPVYETMRKPTLRDRIAISLRVSCWLATRVLAVSTAVKEELIELGIPTGKLAVLPNPAEIERLSEETRRQVRTELGYGDDEVVFTTIGHAVPVKGWDVLLQSFAQVAKHYPRARLQFVGSITGAREREYYQCLNASIRTWGLADRVRFLGDQPDIRVPLAAADVFILPSRSEGNSNALTEAMMFGLPCIATKVGAAADVIAHGENGWLVERNDAEELRDAMLSLARDQGLRQRIVSTVLAQGRCAPTFSEYSDQFVQICREQLDANSTRKA
ncbi:MAG: glycosyltransferase family 4 protein [Phycisphaerales bacterium]|nr:MAG: glycosyltransferase family 4 protein [Phycisphaerales bacterium]